MDLKIAQYLNKDTSNVMEKCFEKLYDSLEQDISLMCNLLNKERNDIVKDEQRSPISILPNKRVDEKDKTLINNQFTENTESTNCDIINKYHLDKILNRIELVIKIITNVNVLEQGGTSYLGNG
jgi:hypothetical protein